MDSEEEKGREGVRLMKNEVIQVVWMLALQKLTNYKNTQRFTSAHTKNFHTKQKHLRIFLSNTKIDSTK
jgi:hypothetical protein